MKHVPGNSFRVLTLIFIALTVLPYLIIAQDRKSEQDSLQAVVIGYPVNPFGRNLFYIKANIGPYSAENRASTISTIIKKLSDSALCG